MATSTYTVAMSNDTVTLNLDVGPDETIPPNRIIHVTGSKTSSSSSSYTLEFRSGTYAVNSFKLSTVNGNHAIKATVTLNKNSARYWPTSRRTGFSLYLYATRGVNEKLVTSRAFYQLREALDPRVEALDIYRCNSSGVRTDDGVYLRCALLRLSRGPEAQISDFTTARMTIKQIGGSASTTVDLTSAANSGKLNSAFGSGGYQESAYGSSSLFYGSSYSNGNSYTLTLELGDAYEKTEKTIDISRAFANLHLSGAPDGGVAIGKYSSATKGHPLFECVYPSAFDGGVESFGSGALCTASQQALGIQCGSVDVQSVPANGNKAITVTFPKPFLSTPLVHAIVTHNHTSYTNGFARVRTVSATSVEILLLNGKSSADNLGFNWIAIGPMGESTAADPGLPEGPTIFEDDTPYVNEGLARADYVAMMTGIDIPVDSGTDTMHDEPQSIDPPGIESEPAPVHSKKFDLVQLYFLAEVWNEQMVNAAVGKWITADEAAEILDTDYE